MNASRSRRARVEALFFGLVVGVTDLIPPHFRYGYVHRVTRRLFQRPMATLDATTAVVTLATNTENTPSVTLTCAIVTGAIDVGGIGSVVEMLAVGLPRCGVRPIVVCTTEGARAARLRAQGIEVVVADDSSLSRMLQRAAVEVVTLHGAPVHLESVARESGIPLVATLHNTEIHYSQARWRHFAAVLDDSVAAVSVSALVRDFHARHVSPDAAARIRVIPNAAGFADAPTHAERHAARRALESVLAIPLEGEVVIVCLARYDAQKNIAGLVASFLTEVLDPRIRLVVAGEPSDWAEVRRADAIRRCSPNAHRVSLLAASDARTLLAAADAFILNSFFEGWPVAATEAAAMRLPLILSDVGGARELVERDPEHSVLIANPTGPAAEVTDAAVRRARRRSRQQSNAAPLGAAVMTVAQRVRSGLRPAVVDGDALIRDMVETHAAILREAAERRIRNDKTLAGERGSQ